MIDHVAVLVRSVERAAAALAKLGVSDIGAKDSFPSEGTAEIYVGDPDRGARLLLMEAIGPGPYQRALEKRGPGLHHVAILDDGAGLVERGVAAGWKIVKPGKVRWLGCSGLPLIEVVPKGTTASPLVTGVELAMPAQGKQKLAALGLDGFVKKPVKSQVGFTLEGRRVLIEDLT